MRLTAGMALRMVLSLLCILLLSSIVTADTTTDTASTTTSTQTASDNPSSTTAPPKAHTIAVGGAGFSFIPNSVTANVGDTIEFDFFPQNHSVARAAYGYPCIPYEDSGVNKTGFWSGFQPISEISDDPPTFSVAVNDTKPIFFYCSAPDACIQDGMVGVINPDANHTLAAQLAFAANATISLSPGEALPAENNPFTTTPGTSSPTDATSTPSTHHSSLAPGAIAGATVGAVAGAALLAGLLLCHRRKRTKTRQNQDAAWAQPGGQELQGQQDMARLLAYKTSAVTPPPPFYEPVGTPYYGWGSPGTPGMEYGYFDAMTPDMHPGSEVDIGEGREEGSFSSVAKGARRSRMIEDLSGPHELPGGEGRSEKS